MRLLLYPSSWLRASAIPIKIGTRSDRGGIVTIDMKEFWEYQTPYEDQQTFLDRPFNDYLRYVGDRANAPVLEQPKRSHFNQVFPKPKGKKQRLLQYPFSWLKTYQVPIEGSTSSGRADILEIDMKKFWNNPKLMPYEDKQIYSHRSFNDYIKYVRDSVSPLRPETKQNENITARMTHTRTALP